MLQLASGREIGSGWNSRGLQTNRVEHLTSVFNSRLVSSCGATGFFFSDLQAIAFQVAVQTGPPDSQESRGSQPASLTHLEPALDVHFAHLFERQRFPVVALPRTLLAVLQLFRQVRQIDEVS